MAVYSLPFGHYERLDEPVPHAHRHAPAERERSARITLRLPKSLERRLEESARLAGVSREAFLERALARSVDPRLGA